MSDVRVERAGSIISVQNDSLLVTVDLELGTFDLSAGGNNVRAAAAEVAIDGGIRLSSRGKGFVFEREETVADGQGSGLAIVLRRLRQSDEPDVSLTVTVYESQPFALLTLTLTNDTRSPKRVESFEPVSGGRLEMVGRPEHWRFYRHGWQSWSPTLVLPCSGEDDPVAPPLYAPGTTAEPKTGRFVSEMVTAVVDPESQVGVVAGFVTTADQFSQVWFDRDGGTLSAASYADGLMVPPGATLTSETLYLEPTGDPLRSLERYGDVLADLMGARPAARAEVASGWCSWYRYFTDVTEENVVSNLDYLVTHRDELPVHYVQLDDGYQADIGDWLTVNEKFPHGMRWLVDRIHGAGYEAGLWLAPFLAGANSQLYAEHPDWVVRYASNTPYIAMLNWGQACYALDLSRDDVIEWLHNVFTTVTREWGFDYVKIDFVYAGAVDGIRANAGMTRAQLYRRGLQTIRDAVGDRFVLGCGNPMGPSIGLVDGSRIGPDVAPFWDPQPFMPIPQRNKMAEPSALNSIRNTLTRYWMHGRLWQNDPDCVLVRQVDSSLTEDEIRSLATAIAMTGGMVLDSDDLPAVSGERQEMLSMLLPVYGRSGTPVDLFDANMPQVLELDCGTHRMLALFNWGEEESAAVVAPVGGPSHAFDVWGNRYLGTLSGAPSLKTPSHGCRLLGVRPVLDRPQVVGTSFHTMQGALEIEHERWDGERLELSLRPVARKAGDIFVHVPGDGQIRAVDGVAAAIEPEGDWVWRVAFELREPLTISLAIS